MTTPLLVRRRSLIARLRSLTAACLAAVMVTTLLQALPASAQPAEDGLPGREQEPIPPVAVREVTADQTSEEPMLATAQDKPEPVWPPGGVAVAVVPSGVAGQLPGDEPVPDAGLVEPAVATDAGGLPVRVRGGSTVENGVSSPGQVRLQVLGQTVSERAGVKGVLLRATPRDVAGDALDRAGPVRLSVGYAGFATGYGADWASRLRLVTLPDCALTNPGESDCLGRPLVSNNNLTAQVVSATVDFADGPVLLALEAGTSGPAGDYSATSLQPSSTWSAGGNSGGFTWSYPMRVPPGVGGPTPSIALSYASQSVDGRHAASNNQPSWMGEGFEAWPGGFIERRYLACADDMDGGANNSTETGDVCWVTDNATLSLNGVSGELLYNSSENRWHLRSDDGSRIERKTGANNGDNNGEYWVVTSTDGTQYWFGAHRLPGWSSGDPVTNSTWTAPVFGNHSGEPCHASSFGSSSCTQAWRWNLDYVVDMHGNSMSYWYQRETNRYARNLNTSSSVSYHRGGYLDHISYGTRRSSGTDNVFTGNPPARVDFAVGDRCLSSCTTHNETRWPDTPWDQECTGSTCQTVAPTFWTTKRLASVTTKVWGGSSYRNVERWTFTHSFPDPGDTTRAGLWLSRISHQGLAGGTASVPDIRFTPVSLDNRVDEIDHSPAMAWHRIARIDTETGGAIAVTYSDRDCESSKPTLHTNTRRCYPVYWAPEGEQDKQLDWFHKYRVSELREVDMVGDQPEVIYRYDYLGGAAWHYTDDDGLVDEEAKTWSVWRGYGQVGVTVGEGDTRRTYTETRFFRGMDGDKLPSGTRSVDVTDSKGGTWPDRDWFAGMAREQITFNGPGGAEVSGQINDPWASSATASRTINGTTVHARFTNTATARSRVVLDGGRGDRVTRVTTSFDSLGMPTQVDDFGEVGVAGDEHCVKNTYTPRNTSAWLMDRVHRTRSFAVSCAATSDPATLDEDDVIADARTWFDGHDYGVAPTRGLSTRGEQMSDWDAGTPSYVTVSQVTYDAHGRVVEARDALDRPTNTAYTPSAGGPVTGTTSTNALGHETTTTLDPALGNKTRIVDPNGKVTDLTYDPLGRLTAAWLPGRDKATQTANLTFAYGIRDNNVSYVTSRRLNPLGNYVTSHSLFDGLLREVQNQAPSPAGGRLLTNTFYDNAGRAFQTYGGYYTTGSPSTGLHVPIEPFDVPTQAQTLFDGAGRVTAEVFRPFHEERWRTSYRYRGDRTDVTPPAGGTATSTVTDAQGRTVELRQYEAPTPTGSYDATTYEYNRKGQLAGVTDVAGNQWSYVYDLRGRQTEIHDPDAGWTRLQYDDADQLTTTIDGNNNVLVYKYDALGRKTHKYWSAPFGTPLATWTYDNVAKGYVDRSIRFIQGQPYIARTNEYNDRYQPTDVDVIIPSAETGLGGTYKTQYTYHVDGSPDSVAWTATADLPTEGLHYEYDPILGLPMSLRATLGTSPTTYVTDTTYNALAQIEQLTLRTGDDADAVRLGYDRELETGRLTSSWVDMDTAPFVAADVRYDYDPAGNINQIADVTEDPDDTQCFEYDYLRRLAEAWTPTSGDCAQTPTTGALGGPAPYWLSWTYDQVGNRLSQVDHQAAETTTYNHPPAGDPQPHTLTSATTDGQTSNWTYDVGGNTLTRPDGAGGEQTLAWDREGHLFTINDDDGATTRYIYDADGNRLVTRDPDGKTLYLPGQEVRWDAAADSLTCTRYYDYHGQTIASRNASGLTWLASDYQGTAQVAITEQGQQVEVRRQTPFGTPRGAAPVWPNSLGFVGGYEDPTGLTHLGAREYDPTIGRFISVDPIMDPANPQQLQGYAYASNNPITYSDPTGLLAVCAPDGINFCPDQPVRNQPKVSGPPQRNWNNGPSCLEYCGSVEDTRLREIVGAPSNGRGSTTGPREAGGARVTYDRAAYAIHGTNYGSLTGDQRVEVNYYVWERNNPEAAKAFEELLAMLGEGEYTLFAELNGFADVDRCFSNGDVGSCVWAVLSVVPLPPLKALKAGKLLGSKLLGKLFGKACSFSADTNVLMADGTTKPISEIEPGDQVLAADPEAGEQTAQTVVAVWGHEDTLVDLQLVVTERVGASIEHYSNQTALSVVSTTADHPFWNQTDQQWQPAEAFAHSDQVLAADGTEPLVVGIAPNAGRRADAYNLTVTEPHTYYVLAGNTPILVHNSGPFCGTPFGRNAPGDGLFHGTDYSLDEMAQLAYGHSGAGHPAMGRPSLGQIETTLRNAGPAKIEGQNAAKFDYNGVRVIINYDKPWKSTSYFPGSGG